MTARPHFAPRARGLLLAGAGLALALGALARGVFLLWDPVPESWADPELWIDAALIAGGLSLGAVGFWLYRRDLLRDHSLPATFLAPVEEEQVLAAIQAFERRTSGEIRVHLEGGAVPDVRAAATRAFERLGMTRTRERNGVLLFVAVQEHAFAVLGDAGIDARVPPGFWDEITRDMAAAFREHRFAEGLLRGINAAGEQLAAHFPPRPDDVDELPNEISRT